jgi:cytochrome c peroxidase
MSCHGGDNSTDSQPHDVGTGGEFVTPTLRWLWMSAPYLHDGRAATLYDLFIIPGTHQLVRDVSLEDIAALEAYLLSLP